MNKRTAASRNLFSGNIDVTLKTAANVLATYPASAAAFARLGGSLKEGQRIRDSLAEEGTEVPPLMIVSTTDTCNLACAGCYACAHQRKPEGELSDARIAEIMREADELGVRIVLLAGGEPLLSHGWMEALGAHEELVGIVFTNGTLLDDARRAWFAAHRHIIPAISVEGDAARTDARRGEGVYAQVERAMRALRAEGIPFGVSITATGENIDSVLDDALCKHYIEMGCRLFVFVEYVPVEPGTEPLVLSKADKQRLSEFAANATRRHPALFIAFPGDEEAYGGCLAAGRGFLHVSASGDVEPCPFAPFSDTNLKHTSLRKALDSALLAKVRENHHLLVEGEGGCALWHNRERLGLIVGADAEPTAKTCGKPVSIP